MPYFTTVATIKSADAVPENFATNTWHFFADDLTALGTVHAQLVTFYQAVDAWFSDLTGTTNALELTSYNDDDSPPRAPVLTGNATLTPGGGAPLPPEVSLVMSFQAVRVSGVPQARRRGRIYLPWLGEAANETTGRPAVSLLSGVQAAGDALVTASKAATTWHWVTYSTVAPGYAEVADGWVDNEWDTQRRRGRESTLRYVFF